MTWISLRPVYVFAACGLLLLIFSGPPAKPTLPLSPLSIALLRPSPSEPESAAPPLPRFHTAPPAFVPPPEISIAAAPTPRPTPSPPPA